MHIQPIHEYYQLAVRHPVTHNYRAPSLQLKHYFRRTPPGGPDSGGEGDTDSSGGGSGGGSDSGSSGSGPGSDYDSDSSSSSSNSATTSCDNGDSAACQNVKSATKTVSIVLAIVIPIVIALVVMFIFHRRHVKRLKQEDATDKYKSCDFGLNDVHIEASPGDTQAMPMSEREKGFSNKHGISLNYAALDPVLLPPPSRMGDRDTSISITSSTLGRSALNPFDDPYNMDPKYSLPGPHSSHSNLNQSRSLTPIIPNTHQPHDANAQLASHDDNEPRSSSSSHSSTATPSHIPRESKENVDLPVPAISRSEHAAYNVHDTSDYDLRDSTQSLERSHIAPFYGPPEVNPDDGKPITNRISIAQPPPGYQLNPDRLTQQGVQPLPPDDPGETPEQRTSRIRSFYKDYFDPNSSNGARSSHYHSGRLFGNMSSLYDENSNQSQEPPSKYISGGLQIDHAPPRRAVTPPPGMISIRESDFTLPFDGLPKDQMSSRPNSPGARVGSSISNRAPPSSPPPSCPLPSPPRRRQPPPEPLIILPTPSKLGDDSVLTTTPIDFAPSGGRKQIREGKHDDPLGGRIPYSQHVPVHMPLASSYDDLAFVPSP